MNIILIGTGNVAFVLGTLMHKAGHVIKQVVGRNRERAGELAGMLGAEPVYRFEAIDQRGDIYIIAITDDALWNIGKSLQLTGGIVLHTAGSVPKEVLQGLGKSYGILYPLQSLRRDRSEIPGIPFLIDADTDETLLKIRAFAETLSPMVADADDHQRMKLHIGAVIANNFSNHLFALAEAFCKEERLNFKLLLPLVRETADRLDQYSPAAMQTGPAVRNDRVTLQKQADYLERYPGIKKIYDVLTESIQAFHDTTGQTGADKKL